MIDTLRYTTCKGLMCQRKGANNRKLRVKDKDDITVFLKYLLKIICEKLGLEHVKLYPHLSR